MSTRHSELRLQGTLEPAFLPLNWKIQTGIHIKPIPADLLLLAPGLAVERDGVFPLILLGFLSILDRLSIRRNAEKSSEEIFSKGICNLSQNSWISISISLP